MSNDKTTQPTKDTRPTPTSTATTTEKAKSGVEAEKKGEEMRTTRTASPADKNGNVNR